ncbi:hypothetical protein J2Z21_001712 [Streptomyces griseochromogenes]|uniref:DUF397 domain-containing protein n=1 Tax=Streptomyces griseochromogenes TaxID=68214 RepID=A0ABS4LN18_9ACTN|nr:hypothetical protein [Streptomyces griseochromogenes]
MRNTRRYKSTYSSDFEDACVEAAPTAWTPFITSHKSQ